ncbi:hypothetical protein NDU88_005045 [Pleurodeles waltl]|uniref:Uncharacterized protein n=1 Tax=Pleurodeles waltl TaxID=8319 RepID=A0AAV7UH02_PLEWA|nr:hypothetical protein NDU88_005045 [Pleurodeles waltl]
MPPALTLLDLRLDAVTAVLDTRNGLRPHVGRRCRHLPSLSARSSTHAMGIHRGFQARLLLSAMQSYRIRCLLMDKRMIIRASWRSLARTGSPSHDSDTSS